MQRDVDPIVFVTGDVVLCEFGTPFTWENTREFSVGEVVYYIEDFKDETSTQATQLYFVTMDEWQALAQHFRRVLGREEQDRRRETRMFQENDVVNATRTLSANSPEWGSRNSVYCVRGCPTSL